MIACTPAESQKVVWLMSMVKTAISMLASASIDWRTWSAWLTSTSAGIVITLDRPTRRSSESSMEFYPGSAGWRRNMSKAMSSRPDARLLEHCRQKLAGSMFCSDLVTHAWRLGPLVAGASRPNIPILGLPVTTWEGIRQEQRIWVSLSKHLEVPSQTAA